jgi:hypothetical protein
MNDILTKALTYLVARLKEPSTYTAMTFVLTAFGAAFSPQQQNAILMIGMAAAGLLGAILPDRISTNTRLGDSQLTKEQS